MLLRRRVLLICSDPALMLLLHPHLLARAYEVFSTPDYSACTRQAYELEPEAVLIAAQETPHTEWLAALEALRGVSPVPIVALIASGEELDRAEALALGASVCLMPPFDGARVAEMVGELVAAREMERRAMGSGLLAPGRWQ